MPRFVRLALIAASLAGGLSVLPGCQMSGRHDDTRRTAGASAEYDRAYVATRDTVWSMGAEAGATRGTVPMGTRAYFASDPMSSGEWQQARVEGHGVVYVHPADYRRP